MLSPRVSLRACSARAKKKREIVCPKLPGAHLVYLDGLSKHIIVGYGWEL